jgi:hypothetical protein
MPATTVFSIAGPTWVTIQFDYHGGGAMGYWMNEPTGTMFSRSMMGNAGMMGPGGGSDSHAFWSWGGTYHGGAAFDDVGSESTPVWFNVSSGVLWIGGPGRRGE